MRSKNGQRTVRGRLPSTNGRARASARDTVGPAGAHVGADKKTNRSFWIPSLYFRALATGAGEHASSAVTRPAPQVLMSVLEKALAGTWTESMANAWTELWQVATVDVRTQEAIAAPF